MSDEVVENLEPAEDDLVRAERLMREAVRLLFKGESRSESYAIMVEELRMLADRVGKIREQRSKETK